MSGGLPNDENCQDNPQSPSSTTGSCNRPIARDFAFADKPLPPPPGSPRSSLRAKKSVQPLDARRAREAFVRREIDTSSLSLATRKVLDHFNRLSRDTSESERVLVELEAEPFEVPVNDVKTLLELRRETAKLPLDRRRRLLKELTSVIDGELEKSGRTGLGGETGEPAEEALIPAPLNVGRNYAQTSVRRTRSLSPLAEHSEGPTGLHTKRSPTLPSRQKHFGSVRNARLAAEAHLAAAGSRPALRHGPLKSSVSTNSLRSPRPRVWRSGLASSPSDEAFINPRRAPSPPYKVVNLGPRAEKFHQTGAQPGNVATPRAAAAEALNAKKSRGSLDSRYLPPRCDDEETHEVPPTNYHSSTRSANFRRVHIPPTDRSILVTKETSITHQASCLRGGGGDGDSRSNSNSNESSDSSDSPGISSREPTSPSQQKNRFVPAIFNRITHFSDPEQPHAALWRLAGGRVGDRKWTPKVQELRERRRVEGKNRGVVGFWGTGFGVRVGRLSRSGIEEGEVGEGEKGEVEGMDESEESEEEKADEENKEEVGGEGSANDERKYSGDG